MPHTNTKQRPEAQACGADCDAMYTCGRRRRAFEQLGVCGHLSDDLPDPAFTVILGMLEQAHESGYQAGREGVAMQLVSPSTRWAA